MLPLRRSGRVTAQGAVHNRGMSLSPPEGDGPLRRERLRTARLYFVCDARPRGEDPEAAAARGAERRRRHRPAAREGAGPGARSSAPPRTFRRVCDTYSALFIVNDDPDLARACDADGVHVGQDDVARRARRGSCSGPRRSSASRPTPRSRSPPRAEQPGRLHQRRPDLGDADESGAARRSGSSWSATPPRTRRIPSSRSAASTPATPRRWSRPGRSGSARCGRSATPPIPAAAAERAAPGASPPREGRGARWLSASQRRAQASAAQAPAARRRADGARLRPRRGAQPGGARGARAAGRGRAADWWSRSAPSSPALIALSIVVGYLAGGRGQRRDNRNCAQVAGAGADHGDHGLGHVARPLLGGARLPADPRLPHLQRRLRPRRAAATRRPDPRHPGLLAVAGTFFYFMVKAMARIQMPTRQPRE